MAPRFDFCRDCGRQAEVNADGEPLCGQCLSLLLAEMKACAVLTRRDGSPLDLQMCPACGTSRDSFLESGFVGCPSCYAAFRVAVRRRRAELEPTAPPTV